MTSLSEVKFSLPNKLYKSAYKYDPIFFGSCHNLSLPSSSDEEDENFECDCYQCRLVLFNHLQLAKLPALAINTEPQIKLVPKVKLNKEVPQTKQPPITVADIKLVESAIEKIGTSEMMFTMDL